jgi:hypothetical protein
MVAEMAARGEEILGHERVEAWNEYLHVTNGQPECRYEETEPWAWSRLQVRLKAIDARASVLGERARGDHDGEDDGA